MDGQPSYSPLVQLAGPGRVRRGPRDAVDGRPGLADLAIICESRENTREASRALFVQPRSRGGRQLKARLHSDSTGRTRVVGERS